MTKNDFLNLLADAGMDHEGFISGSVSDQNNNPGNLKFIGQKGSTVSNVPPGRNFAKFADFYAGRQAMIDDLTYKLEAEGYWSKTFLDLYTRYLGTDANTKDVLAYATSVCTYINNRNWSFVANRPILPQVQSQNRPTALMLLNQIHTPNDWKKAQVSIMLTASFAPDYGFTTRYSNVDLQGFLENDPAPGGQTFVGISAAKTKELLSTVSEGQIFNFLVYQGDLLLIHGIPAGGEEIPVNLSNVEPFCAYASVYFSPRFDAGSIARAMFHETIHELFSLAGDPDTLHAYLLAHGGYTANLLTDLKAVFASEALRLGAAELNWLQRTTQQLVGLLKKLFSKQ